LVTHLARAPDPEKRLHPLSWLEGREGNVLYSNGNHGTSFIIINVCQENPLEPFRR
jgi:hypothetical protein